MTTTLETPEEPVSILNDWQAWYNANIPNPAPGGAKENREKLHDTSNATYEITDWRTHYHELLDENKNTNIYKKKLVEHFCDSICEFQNELTGLEIYKCFEEAAKQMVAHVKKEYDTIKELTDVLHKYPTNVK